MGHDSDDDEHSSSRDHHSSRRRRDPRQCKLEPEGNSFNFRKNRMKARVKKEQKMRDLRAAAEARKRRSSSRRSNNRFDDDEIEESGTTEAFHASRDSSNVQDPTEIVPFAAAEPLPDPSNPSDGINMNIAPSGTISASSAEVLSGEGRRQVSSSSDSSEDDIEDESVLSLGAEATPVHNTHQQNDRVENLERENQELREQLDHERRRSYRRQTSSNESKNRQACSRKCKIISFVIFLFLCGGAGVYFFLIRGSPAPSSLSVPVKQMSIPPTFAPTSEASRNTDPPTQELYYDAPSTEECETIANGGRLEGEQVLRISRYNVELDVELTSTATVEEAINVITNATRKILIPDLVGCFGAHRNLLDHGPLRRNLAKPVPLYNPNRYAIANGNSTIRLAEGRSCEGQHGGPCFGIDVILHLAAKNADEKQFVFQSLIIEVFGRGDLAASLNLDDLLTSMTLIDVKINVETDAPSEVPTKLPTPSPSQQPSDFPSLVPSKVPTKAPTPSPSALPSHAPTILPSHIPSQVPTSTPTTGVPTSDPSAPPSRIPTQSPTVSVSPTTSPTVSQAPTTTRMPTRKPTVTPSKEPTLRPSSQSLPTDEPTLDSVGLPTDEPSLLDPDSLPLVRVPTSSPLEVVVDFEPTS